MATKIEWTEHTNRCEGCGRVFRIPKDAWDQSVEDEPGWNDDERSKSFDFCGPCVSGENPLPGEYVLFEVVTTTTDYVVTKYPLQYPEAKAIADALVAETELRAIRAPSDPFNDPFIAFVHRREESLQILAAITARVRADLGLFGPQDATFEHVGDLDYAIEQLTELNAFLHGEG